MLNRVSGMKMGGVPLNTIQKNIETVWYRGRSFLSRLLKNNDAALEYLNILIEKKLASADDWHAVGVIYENKQEWDQAAHALLQAVEKSARKPRYVYHLGTIKEKSGNTLAAEEMYNEALEKEKGLLAAVLAKGQLLYKKGNYRKASECFQKGAKQRPKDADILNNLAMCYLQLEELAPALLYLEKANELNPDNDEILFNLASVQIKLERFKQAIVCLKRISLQFQLPVLLALAYCYGCLEDYSKSLEIYYKALIVSGHSREILVNIASVYAKAGESEQALNILRRLISVNPYDVELLNNAGWIYEQKDDYLNAESLYYRGLALSGGDPYLAYNLIFCLKRQRKHHEALELISYLKEAPGWHKAGWSVLAQLYEGLGADRQAADCYNKALGLD